MSLKSQRQMASKILKVGENRVWIDPARIDDVETAISREDIRRLIREKAIKKIPEKGISRARARLIHAKKVDGKRRGQGTRSGKKGARTPSKEVWIRRIRAQRRKIHQLRDKHVINESIHRQLYIKAKSGSFHSVKDLERYIESHLLRRKR